jgi:PAS domain S-box-containing protein
LFEFSPDALCVADVDGNLRRVNPAFAAILGYRQDEVVGRPFVAQVHPDDAVAVNTALRRVVDGNQTGRFQCRHLGADGSVRWLDWVARADRDEGVVYGVGRDVTERRTDDAILRRLADEQAALRRVATLLGEGVPPVEVFAAVTAEVEGLFDCAAGILMFEHDPPGVAVVGVSERASFLAGIRTPFEDGLATTKVRRTHQPSRADPGYWVSGDGPLATAGRQLGVASSVATPIDVEGRLWGAINLWSSDELPAGTEERLENFTELVATAIANAESREALRLLSDEQAALRRVATLVAKGGPAEEIFSAVSNEVARLFGDDLAYIGRFDDAAPVVTYMGLSPRVQSALDDSVRLVVGTRIELRGEETTTERVYATGRPARLDWSTAASPMGTYAQRLAVASAVSTPIIVDGRAWGVISVGSTSRALPPNTEQRLERFGELVATAIANAESRSELAASRRRIVAASDDARRRIERNLHDGTQQRLVSLALAVRAMENDLPPESSGLAAELGRIAAGLTDAVFELQEISRGIHPAALTQSGLGAALRTLGRRSAVPVQLDIAIEGRLPEPVEVGAYYVASEALANATKYAHASRIDISLRVDVRTLTLTVRDDGVGGADPERGSGLVGLSDRVAALGGSIEIRSTAGQGTEIRTELPLDAGSLGDHED